ncbi:MAG: hypothetical protein DMG85_01580 [Acidobacteria bacterium]|nr:MAG: hypothetical protein DMG85_01580 [Acidobacteriota bacterium]
MSASAGRNVPGCFSPAPRNGQVLLPNPRTEAPVNTNITNAIRTRVCRAVASNRGQFNLTSSSEFPDFVERKKKRRTKQQSARHAARHAHFVTRKWAKKLSNYLNI